jgi:enamine deaminase RidA (YjgF/YER057c/UK114 family)
MRSAEHTGLPRSRTADEFGSGWDGRDDLIGETAGTGRRAVLASLGLQLPGVSPPKGAYIPAVRTGNLVYVSGQVPMVDGELIAMGKVGADISTEYARELSQRCALAALAAIDDLAGLDNVTRVVKVVGFVASAPGYAEQPTVVNGASDLFVAVFGDAGRHARSSIGVAELPLGSPVEIEVVVEVGS